MGVCDLYYIQLTISVGSDMLVWLSYVGMIDADYWGVLSVRLWG